MKFEELAIFHHGFAVKHSPSPISGVISEIGNRFHVRRFANRTLPSLLTKNVEDRCPASIKAIFREETSQRHSKNCTNWTPYGKNTA